MYRRGFVYGYLEVIYYEEKTCCNYYGVYNDDIGLFDGAVTRRILQQILREL